MDITKLTDEELIYEIRHRQHMYDSNWPDSAAGTIAKIELDAAWTELEIRKSPAGAVKKSSRKV